ncbi:MAG: ABC transporter permease [Smithella sp.]
MNYTRLKAVIRKEFYHLIRDYRSLYLAFAIPLLLIILFGYALSLDVDNVKTVVIDYDKTELSRDFLTRLTASPYFRITYLDETKKAVEYLDNNLASAVIVIPPDFMKNIRADRTAELQIIIDGSDPNFAGIIRNYLTVICERYNQKLLMNFLNRQNLSKLNPPADGRIRVWFNEDLESRNFIVPGIIALIIMIVAALLTSLVIAREYENGTMETIKSLPLRAGEFYLGKAAPYFLIALTDVLIAMISGQILFGVAMKGHFWLMLIATSLYIFVALSLGLFISNVTKSQMIANQMAILLTYLPSLLLSNFVFPIINMPAFLQYITYLVPARYYIDILMGIYLRNTGFSYLWFDMLILFAFFAILSMLNFRILRKEGL